MMKYMPSGIAGATVPVGVGVHKGKVVGAFDVVRQVGGAVDVVAHVGGLVVGGLVVGGFVVVPPFGVVVGGFLVVTPPGGFDVDVEVGGRVVVVPAGGREVVPQFSQAGTSTSTICVGHLAGGYGSSAHISGSRIASWMISTMIAFTVFTMDGLP